MQLEHVFAPGRLMQAVDVLRDDRLELAAVLGYHLQQLRLSHGLSQEEAAEVFDLSLKTWQRYEQGVVCIPLPNLVKIHEKWDFDVNYFLFRNDYDVVRAMQRAKRSQNIKHY